MTFDSLADDVLCHVLSYLELHELVCDVRRTPSPALASTNQRLRTLCCGTNAHDFWQQLAALWGATGAAVATVMSSSDFYTLMSPLLWSRPKRNAELLPDAKIDSEHPTKRCSRVVISRTGASDWAHFWTQPLLGPGSGGRGVYRVRFNNLTEHGCLTTSYFVCGITLQQEENVGELLGSMQDGGAVNFHLRFGEVRFSNVEETVLDIATPLGEVNVTNESTETTNDEATLKKKFNAFGQSCVMCVDCSRRVLTLSKTVDTEGEVVCPISVPFPKEFIQAKTLRIFCSLGSSGLSVACSTD
eukprot:PhM_4_TR2088/c0_g1_i5/m.72273